MLAVAETRAANAEAIAAVETRRADHAEAEAERLREILRRLKDRTSDTPGAPPEPPLG